MRVNGEQINLQKEIVLNEFLQQQGYDIQRVAVEKNGDIIPKKSYETEMLSDGDKLEIVQFVGGG